MLKRTKGRLLLTLLVITGLAGTLKDTSLSHKERKNAMALMKDTKAIALKSIKGLSERQLNYTASPNRWSIKECIYHIAISEKDLWSILEKSLKGPSNSEKRAEIKMTDDQLVKMIEDRSTDLKTSEIFEPKNIVYKTMDDALNAFKAKRTDHIKYIKTTTEDLRNHVVQMSFGWIDCYQLCLMMASYSNRCTQQIEEVKADPTFPKH
jgi:hypothetical protein